MSQVHQFVKAHDYACWCGQTAARTFCKQMVLGRQFVVLECDDCHTQRILPKALSEQGSAETLYNEYEMPDYAHDHEEQFIASMLKRFQETGVGLGQGKKVLDVGCGSGVLLETVCRQFSCAGTGIDVDQRRIAKAKARSRQATFRCELFDGTNIGEKFDTILSIAVIEHVIDPPGLLKQFHSALADDGSMFLLTPNARSLNYRLLRSWWRELLSLGEHIYLFTPESLELCARQAGFELVKCSSDFDWGPLELRVRDLRSALIWLWAIYCKSVKRLSSCLASRQGGDILYAHFKKVKTG